MPFDAAPVRSPLPDNIAGQSALVLDMVEFYFRDGAQWAAGHGSGRRTSSACLKPSIFVRREIGYHSDQHSIICRARSILTLACLLGRIGQPSLVIAFNDAPGRIYAEIAAVLRTAKALAEMDARAFDEEEKRNAVDDSDPIDLPEPG